MVQSSPKRLQRGYEDVNDRGEEGAIRGGLRGHFFMCHEIYFQVSSQNKLVLP